MTIVVFIPNLLRGGETVTAVESVSTISAELVIAPIFLVVVALLLGWRREIGLKPIDSWRSLWVLWLPSLYVLFFFTGAVLTGLSLTQATVFALINAIFVGIAEELMFRGFIFYGALTQFRVWTAIIFTSVIFGAVHVLNGFATGDFLNSSVQAVAAGMSGFWFMAIRVLTKSIYPAMLMHALFDCSLFFLSGTGSPNTPPSVEQQHSIALTRTVSLIVPILFVLPLFLYGLWYLRGIGDKTKEEILGLNENPSAV